MSYDYIKMTFEKTCKYYKCYIADLGKISISFGSHKTKII